MLDGFVLLSVGLKLSGADWTPAGLWLAVVASGLYHGVNPGMGWPLAVSAALMERSSRALLAALWPISVGHLLAMLLVILPFALLIALVEWQRQIQIGASLLVIGFGIFRLVNRRHPRALARIRPTQLGLWSFAVAIAHGAGLMLVPVYLGLCRAADLDKGHAAAGALINANLGMAVLVSVVHSGAMIAAGGLLAWLVYRYLGLKFVSRSWFNLDAIWAVSLILVGAVSLAIGLASRHLDTSRTMQSEQCWSDVAAMHNVNVINFSLGSFATQQVRLLSELSGRLATRSLAPEEKRLCEFYLISMLGSARWFRFVRVEFTDTCPPPALRGGCSHYEMCTDQCPHGKLITSLMRANFFSVSHLWKGVVQALVWQREQLSGMLLT